MGMLDDVMQLLCWKYQMFMDSEMGEGRSAPGYHFCIPSLYLSCSFLRVFSFLDAVGFSVFFFPTEMLKKDTECHSLL